jgi:hypothetical protein
VSADTLGDSAATVRNFAFASFWVQLPLTIVSAGILFFAISFSKAVSTIATSTHQYWQQQHLGLLAGICAGRPLAIVLCRPHKHQAAAWQQQAAAQVARAAAAVLGQQQ